MPFLLIPIIILIVVIVVLGYVKAPPDTAIIISGFRKPRTLIGRAGVRIPFFERIDRLSLKMMSVDVRTTDFVPNCEYINVKVDATVQVKIGNTPDMMTIAAKFFLNEKEDMIILRIQDTLEGNMREIIGQMKLSEMVTDRKAFGEKVQENAIPDLMKMGLELVSFNVQSFSDQNGVIDDLGIDNISKIKREAAIAKAQADRDVAIAQSIAQREANDARVKAEIEIAEKNTALTIRQAELKQQSDIKAAEADAAYAIQEQEQRKSIETSTVNADIAKTEREAELKAKEVEVEKQRLDAEIRAKADAQKYAEQQKADAELYRRQKEAEAKRVELEEEAKGIKAKAVAEAEGIRAKAVAEAEGIDKKAEAMKKYGEAAVIDMVMTGMQVISKNVAQPLSQVDHITMYGDGNNTKLLSDIINGTNQIANGVSEGMGIDLKALISGILGGHIANNDKPVVIQNAEIAADCPAPDSTDDASSPKTGNEKPETKK